MCTFISVILALRINFYSPEIPENKKSMVINKNYYQRIGFPYQYFLNEFLSEDEVDCRLRLIYIYLMFGVSTSLPLATSAAVMLPIPPTDVKRIMPNQVDSQINNCLKSAPVVSSRIDKISYKEIASEELDSIIFRFMVGEIDKNELDLILQFRGGDGLADVVGVIGFIILVNWLDSLVGVKSFQANPLPHLYG